MANDLEFDDKKRTIFELVKEKKLPLVVRVSEEERDDDRYDYYQARISGKTEVFLQKTLKLKYVLIKVLRYYDKDAIQKKHGPEYVLEHDTYVGKEFYIPVKYNGSFMFAYRPGSRRRYATISQVLDELPRYISLGEVTEATNSSGQKVTIPAMTKLELRQKHKDPLDGTLLLDCSDGDRSFSFSGKDRINCTDVDDPKTYFLFEHVRNKMLPKVIVFQNVAPKDCILMDEELNSALLTSMEGPIELLGFEDIEVVVGWVRDKEAKTYKTVLIPSGIWHELIVQEKSLYSEDDKMKYIGNRYKHCGNTHFLETCLYWMYPEKSLVTWLRSPDFYKRTVSGAHMFEPLTDDFQDSSDDEDGMLYQEIFEPAPPLPVRKATVRERHEHHKKAKEKKSLFHKVHKELLEMVKHVYDKDHKGDGHPPKVPKRRQFYNSEKSKNVTGGSSNVEFTSDSTDVSVLNVRQKAITSESKISDSDSDPYQFDPPSDSDNSYDYPYMDRMIENVKAHKRPLPKPPEKLEPEHYTDTGLLKSDVKKEQQSENIGPKYVSVTMSDVSHIFQDNQTKDDFFRYTVTETAQCFKHCGLSDFSDKCLTNKIDGSFFKNFDVDELKKMPFHLSNFHILKVKKIIFDGWRPKVFEN